MIMVKENQHTPIPSEVMEAIATTSNGRYEAILLRAYDRQLVLLDSMSEAYLGRLYKATFGTGRSLRPCCGSGGTVGIRLYPLAKVYVEQKALAEKREAREKKAKDVTSESKE